MDRGYKAGTSKGDTMACLEVLSWEMHRTVCPRGDVKGICVRARDLKCMDIDGSDPYVLLKIGKSRWKSSLKDNTQNPVWNEEFELLSGSPDTDTLHVTIYDKDGVVEDVLLDDVLGSASVSVMQIRQGGPKGDRRFELEVVDTDKKGAGILTLENVRFAGADKDFVHADADGDNKLSREEWIAHFGSADGFDDADVDGDGQVDAEEWMALKAQEKAQAQPNRTTKDWEHASEDEDDVVQPMEVAFLKQMDLNASTDSGTEEEDTGENSGDEEEYTTDRKESELASLVTKYFRRFDLNGEDELTCAEDMEMLTITIFYRLEAHISTETVRSRILENGPCNGQPPTPHNPLTKEEYIKWIYQWEEEGFQIDKKKAR